MGSEVKTEENEDGLEGPKLNDRQLAFCREYVIDFNSKQAAIRAGYSDNPDSACVQGSLLLSYPKVRAEIDRILVAREDAQKEEIRARVLDELAKIAMDDIKGSDVLRDKEGNAIGVNRKDRIKALELLGKYSALFIDKVELAGSVGATPMVDATKLSATTKAELAQAYAESLDRK
jgi:Phage terminase, small subunit